MVSAAAGVALRAPTNLSIASFNMEHALSFLPGPQTPPTCRFAVETLHPRLGSRVSSQLDLLVS